MPASADAAGLAGGFGVYVHWPFCESKCPYCDFNSHVRESVDARRWQKAYLAEIDRAAQAFGGRPADTVFFGGGTPSRMPPAMAAAIVERIAEAFSLKADAEITLEANPTSVEADRFHDLRAAGVNRLSLGVQSLDDEALRFLGRRHDAAAARAALALAQQVFPRSSFDLIYARPGQTVAAWRDELGHALGLGPVHMSLYQLTLERGTRFFDDARHGRLTLPAGDESADLYEATIEQCGAAGLDPYEVSNYARTGEECHHNLVYWRSGDWAGIGPGAHGRRTGGHVRTATRAVRSPERWLEAAEHGSGSEPDEVLDEAAVLREFVLMGLRLSEGLDAARFLARTGRDLGNAFSPARESLSEAGLVDWDGARLRATPAGRLVLNRVIETLLDAAEREGA